MTLSFPLRSPVTFVPLNMSTVQEWLVDTRMARKLGQDEVDRRTRDLGARVSQSYLSQLERGVKSLEELGGPRAEALRRVYGISPEDWVRHTGLSLVTPDNVAATAPTVPDYTLSAALRAFIEEYSGKFKELLEPRWQRWLAQTDFRDEPETPEDWLTTFLYFREKVNPR